MESTLKDRRIATLVPVATAVLVWSTYWAIPLLVIAYLVVRRQPLVLTREVLLRILDLFLSILILAVAVGLLISALDVVARDGEIQLLQLLNRILKILLVIGLAGYGYISLGFSAFRAWRGQLHNPKLSIGILQALRGRPKAAI
jgi:glucan phosphoethanolaminetransferase (alkaline phosphatase superfamily)